MVEIRIRKKKGKHDNKDSCYSSTKNSIVDHIPRLLKTRETKKTKSKGSSGNHFKHCNKQNNIRKCNLKIIQMRSAYVKSAQMKNEKKIKG